jgi:hypothetical protein
MLLAHTENLTATLLRLNEMIISLIAFYKIFLQDSQPIKNKPVYHRTWKDEVEGYPASSYAKSLQMVIH